MGVQLKLDLNRPIQQNFMGNNAVYHGYAGMPDDAGRVYSEELCELEADRAATLGVRVVRTFYKWYAWDAEKQEWNWESEKMQVFYRWLDRMKKRNIQVALQIGWCSPGDINSSSWNGESPFTVPGNWEASVQNYANWASENLYQLIELRGYTNIKYIMLFTEPQRPSGKVPQGKTPYTLWRDCAVAVHKALLRDGRRNLVQIIGPNEGSTSNSVMNAWVSEHCPEAVDIYSSHNYQDRPADERENAVVESGVRLGVAGSRIQQLVTLQPQTEYTLEFDLETHLEDPLHISGGILFGAWSTMGGERGGYQISAGGQPTNRLNQTAIQLFDGANLKTGERQTLTHTFNSKEATKAFAGLFFDLKTGAGGPKLFSFGLGAAYILLHGARLYQTADPAKTNLLHAANLDEIPAGDLLTDTLPQGKFEHYWLVYAAYKCSKDPYLDLKACAQTAMSRIPAGAPYWFDEYNVRCELNAYDKPEHGTHLAALMLALMNSGAQSSVMWTLFDQQWPSNHTNNADGFVDGDHRYGVMPVLTRSVTPYPAFYAVALIMRLMGGGAGTCVYGDDGEKMVHASMTVQPDGNLAVAVVNNKSRAEEISVQFSKALGVRLKRRLYNPATIVPDEKAAFLEPDREFDCNDRLTDKLPPNAVVVYSTL